MRGTQRSFCFPESDPFLRYSFYFFEGEAVSFPLGIDAGYVNFESNRCEKNSKKTKSAFCTDSI